MQLFENIYHIWYLNHIDEMNVSKTNRIKSFWLITIASNILALWQKSAKCVRLHKTL